MVSVEGLAKLVDPSQLTDDFEGSLDYNHEEWMDLRVSLEEFMSNAVHLLSRLEDLQVGAAKAQRMGVTAMADMTSVSCLLQELLSKKDFPADVEGSRRLIEEHTQLKKKVSHYQYRCRHSQRLYYRSRSSCAKASTIQCSPTINERIELCKATEATLLQVLKAPVEELDQEGQRLLQCIRSSDGFSGRNCISGSADFQSLVPKVRNVQPSKEDLPAYSFLFMLRLTQAGPKQE